MQIVPALSKKSPTIVAPALMPSPSVDAAPGKKRAEQRSACWVGACLELAVRAFVIIARFSVFVDATTIIARFSVLVDAAAIIARFGVLVDAAAIIARLRVFVHASAVIA